MGDDSTKRVVYGAISGIEEMYNIVPNKGEGWICNKSHILSLKWCMGKDNKAKGWAAKSVVNISIEDYLKLSNSEKKHLMLYKNAVEYKEVNHFIEPYFLGLWLGDGSKNTVEVTTNDFEIVDYLYDFASRHNLSINKHEAIRYYLGIDLKRKIRGIVNGVYCEFDTMYEANRHFGYHEDNKFEQSSVFKQNNMIISEKKINKVKKELIRLNLSSNKHIPNEYLIDSRNNRMQLLAGLVDSDGHIQIGSKNKLPKSVEITQKIYTLANGIKELALSLGFYASINKKIAKMKRLDGSIYECPVYKVIIYGDLWQIPTKIKRKQVPFINFSKNRRTSAHTGFHIDSIGIGEYYGFAVDKNSLFLLEDGTVVHNTKRPVSIKERQSTVRFCSEIDGSFNRRDYPYFQRKQLYTTTVEIERGEEDNYEFQEMTANSNPLDRNDNNRTKTGLYTIFLPAQKGMYFDNYGYPNEEKATIYLLNEMKKLQDDGDTRGLSSFKRKNPMNFKMAFSADGTTALYDPELINIQLDDISWKDGLTEFGNLEWKDGFEFVRPIVKDNGELEYVINEVEWIPTNNGKYEKVAGWMPKEPNKVYINRGKYLPNNNYANRIGCDPFKYDETKDKRRSNCAAFNYQLADNIFKNDKFNDTFTIKYSHRASSTKASNMDVLKMAWWCGCKVLFERNIDHWKKDFQDWDCEAFLMYLPGETEPGIYTDGKRKTVQTICNYTESYINQFIRKVFFKSLLRKETGWLGFKVEDTQKFDEPMAAGFTLISVKGVKYSNVIESKDIESIMPYRKAI